MSLCHGSGGEGGEGTISQLDGLGKWVVGSSSSGIKKGGRGSGMDDGFGSQGSRGIYVSWRHVVCNPNCSQQSPNKAETCG